MNTHYTGRAGEYAVAAQLLLREIPVAFPAVDTGVDLIVADRIKIQVKSARRRKDRASGEYVFTMAARTPKTGHKQYWLKLRPWQDVCDFMVFWGIDENRFWVVPASEYGKHQPVQTLLLGCPRGSRRTQVDHQAILREIAKGKSQRQVAQDLGFSEMCVSTHVRGIHGEKSKVSTLGAAVDNYENAWHEIESAVRLVAQIDSEIPAETELLKENA